MSEEREERCETCRHWHDCVAPRGVCRRNPPTATKPLEEGGVFGLWPYTGATAWCGEWQGRVTDDMIRELAKRADVEAGRAKRNWDAQKERARAYDRLSPLPEIAVPALCSPDAYGDPRVWPADELMPAILACLRTLKAHVERMEERHEPRE